MPRQSSFYFIHNIQNPSFNSLTGFLIFFTSIQINTEVFINRRLSNPKGAFYYYEFKRQTEDIVNNLETDSEHKQVA